MIDKIYVQQTTERYVKSVYQTPAERSVLKDWIMHHQRWPLFIDRLWLDANKLDIMGKMQTKSQIDHYLKSQTICYVKIILDRVLKHRGDEYRPLPD